jgi:hypothetical protein
MWLAETKLLLACSSMLSLVGMQLHEASSASHPVWKKLNVLRDAPTGSLLGAAPLWLLMVEPGIERGVDDAVLWGVREPADDDGLAGVPCLALCLGVAIGAAAAALLPAADAGAAGFLS